MNGYRILPLLVLLATPEIAGAQEPSARLQLRSRTLFLPARVTDGGQDHDGSTMYQWLELVGQDLQTPGLSVHTSVWGFGAFGNADVSSDRVTDAPYGGDVDILYVEYADLEGRLIARAGRQLALGAPATGFYGQIDGGYLRGALGNFTLEVTGGHVVQERFRNFGKYDWMVGGRGGFHMWRKVNGGVSYLHARTDGDLGREVGGADLAVVFSEHADLAASLAYDLVDPGVLESRTLVRFEPIDRVTLGAGGEWASPGRLIDKTSIFSVFSLGDYAEANGLVEYAVTEQWSVGARYARVFFSDDDGEGLGDSADRFGAAVRGYPYRTVWVTVEGDRLPSDDNGYTSIRLATRWIPAERWSGVVDLLGYFYDDPPLSRAGAGAESLVARAFAERQFGDWFYLGIGGEVAETVLASYDLRGFVRLIQNFDLVEARP